MTFWRKSEKSDARRDAKAHFLLVKSNTKKIKFYEKVLGREKISVLANRQNEVQWNITNFQYLVLNFRVTPAMGGHQGVVMGSHASFVKNASNPRNTHIYGKSRIFKNRWKMDLNQVIYTVFRAEFESGSKIGPKPTQNPILTKFSKIRFL